MSDEPLQPAAGRGTPERRTRRVGDVTHEHLDALRAELLQEIRDGDDRVTQQVLTMMSDLKSDMVPELGRLSTCISDLNAFMRQQKDDDAEEARLQHEEGQKQLWLAEIQAKQEAVRRAQRERLGKVIPIANSLLVGVAIGATLGLISQLQAGVRWTPQLAIVIAVYGAVAILMIIVYRHGT